MSPKQKAEYDRLIKAGYSEEKARFAALGSKKKSVLDRLQDMSKNLDDYKKDK